MTSNSPSDITSTTRLSEIPGFEERKNDIIYGPPLKESENPNVVVFFPGDVQDYIENMESHRDNKHHKQWNVESTAEILRKKFPDSHVLLVKPSSMGFKTFSCYQNFVNSNSLGVPEHSCNHNSLKHLFCLLKSVSQRLISNNVNPCLDHLALDLIGFSKGCVVLNQFLYEFHNFSIEVDEDVKIVLNTIRNMYWLDGGHSGGKNTWVTDKKVLESVSKMDIFFQIHVTPYQIQDDRRPWIKKEEKAFFEFLQKRGCKVDRVVHYENVPPSLVIHFEVINSFK